MIAMSSAQNHSARRRASLAVRGGRAGLRKGWTDPRTRHRDRREHDRGRLARPVREYLAALDAALPAAPDEREPAPSKYKSSIDPQAVWAIKHGPGRFSYTTNYLIDSETSVSLQVKAAPTG